MVNFRDIYDVSAREKAIIEEKAARRIQLRNEYLKKHHNPYKTPGILFDEPVQRLMSLRVTRIEFNRPTFLSWAYNVGIIFVPILLMCYIVKKERNIKEHQYRTGQIAYKDRFNKFI